MDGVDVVAEARNGIDAVSEAQRTSPDLVLLDVHMPGANGY
jgi:YesN/AraC family two-component response regulator